MMVCVKMEMRDGYYCGMVASAVMVDTTRNESRLHPVWRMLLGGSMPVMAMVWTLIDSWSSSFIDRNNEVVPSRLFGLVVMR